MTPIERWLEINDLLARLSSISEGLLEIAKEQKPPEKLRKALPEDIKEGNIIWYHPHGEYYWQRVNEIRYINDPFKAYVADDGCRYGLNDAWVEER